MQTCNASNPVSSVGKKIQLVVQAQEEAFWTQDLPLLQPENTYQTLMSASSPPAEPPKEKHSAQQINTEGYHNIKCSTA